MPGLAHLRTVVLDCADPTSLAAFYLADLDEGERQILEIGATTAGRRARAAPGDPIRTRRRS